MRNTPVAGKLPPPRPAKAAEGTTAEAGMETLQPAAQGFDTIGKEIVAALHMTPDEAREYCLQHDFDRIVALLPRRIIEARANGDSSILIYTWSSRDTRPKADQQLINPIDLAEKLEDYLTGLGLNCSPTTVGGGRFGIPEHHSLWISDIESL